MVNQTTNHGLDIDYGLYDDWDYNDEMEYFEEVLHVRDQESNRSNYTPYSGALFIATDTGAVYDGDGTSWNKATRSLSELSVDTSPSADFDVVRNTDISDLTDFDPEDWDILDASDYGFDGTRSGDIVQWMIDNGPAKFVFPEGDYSIEQGFSAKSQGWSQFAIIGKGDGANFYIENDTIDDFITSGSSSTPVDHAVMKNFDIHVDPANDIDAGFARLACNDYLEIENVELVGTRVYSDLKDAGTGTHGSQFNLRINMVNPDSYAHVKNVRFTDGGVGSGTPRVIPFGVEPPNEGTIMWEGCHAANWAGNGYYLKDGTGTSILYGCTGVNMGGQAFRFGQQDMSIGGRTVTDSNIDNLDHGAGTHLDIHRAEGTCVMGHRCIDTYGTDDIVRARAGNEQATIRDLFITTNGTSRCIRTSSTDSGDDNVATHGEGMLVIDNALIEVSSDHTSANKRGAIQVRRKNTVLNNVTVRMDVPNTSIAALEFVRGDLYANNCRFTMTDNNNAGYIAILGPDDSTETEIGDIQFDTCEFQGTIYTYSQDNVPYMEYVGCNFRDLGGSSPWAGDDPADAVETGNYDAFTFMRNTPYTRGTDYGFLAQQEIETDTARFYGNFRSGINPAETITETSSPKSWNFDGSEERDIHVSTDVTISNSSGASATEDITVELYDGSDTTGTLIDSETQSISVADGASTTATFIASEAALDVGTYHIEITQSGTALTIDQADENTKGAEYTWSQNNIGELSIADQDGSPLLIIDPITGKVTVSNGALSTSGSMTADAYSARNNGSSGGLGIGSVNYSEFSDAARIYNSASSPSWAFRHDDGGWTNAFEIRPEGYGNPGGPSNLSGTTGTFDGEERIDDGTNTPARGTKCIWDDTNGVWRPQHDPTQSFT